MHCFALQRASTQQRCGVMQALAFYCESALMHVRIRTMRRDFEDGVYWDELAEICGEMSRAAGFRGAARFRGNTAYG